MFSRPMILIGCLFAVSGCSGAIYRTSTLSGNAPIAITVDSRQRVLLSQPAPPEPPSKATGAASDTSESRAASPAFRRFCAEPSPDVFTVLGVSASGGGSLDLSGTSPKSASAALQAAFSSSETGATIARTQTVTMLREMMFRTCERYLSGAISAEEFPIIAARDQRIMVSILAIEQLTGSITPRALAITAGGNASTGYNPTEMVKLLAAGQASLKDAEDDVVLKKKKLGEADVPAGNCAALRKQKADGTPAMTADDTTKLAACDKAQKDLDTSIAARDVAQARYDDLVKGSRSGLGVSSAATSGSVTFDDSQARSDSIIAVALSVEKIVGSTFAQDETQLFCIRMLKDQGQTELSVKCQKYLLDKVESERLQLYGLSKTEYQTATTAGTFAADQLELLAVKVQVCVMRASESAAFKASLAANGAAAAEIDKLFSAANKSRAAIISYLFDKGPTFEDAVAKSFPAKCA